MDQEDKMIVEIQKNLKWEQVDWFSLKPYDWFRLKYPNGEIREWEGCSEFRASSHPYRNDDGIPTVQYDEVRKSSNEE